MTNIEEILTDSGRATADMAVDIISQKPELFSEAYDLCMKQDGKMSMRAARVVWLVAEEMHALFKPYFSDMVYRLPELTHSSVKRCMLKILSVYDLSDQEELHGIIIDVCFSRVNDPEEEIAVRGYSLQVLERMIKIYPEVTGELMSALQLMIESGPDTLSRYAAKRLKRIQRTAIP
jgi:hypothetical protein